MQAVQDEINPFALMLDPEGVYQAMERCESLAKLKRRICRPLDMLNDDDEPVSELAALKSALRAMAGSKPG